MVDEQRDLSRGRVLAYSLVMSIVGLVALILAAIGLWTYATHGVVLSRAGEPMHDAWALWYVALVVIGAGVIRHSLRFYRHHEGSARR